MCRCRSVSKPTTDLLLVDFQNVTIHHLEILRSFVWRHALTVEEEAAAGETLALLVAKGMHQLAELGGFFDFEEDLVVAVRHLDVEMLRGGVFVLVARGRG